MPGSLTRSSPTSLRAWQRHALDRLAEWREGPFLISAAPGAGKTRPALELAGDLLSRGRVRRVVVLFPTTPACSCSRMPRGRTRPATSTAWP
jgi:superfamily II DNA or RNA helicase